MRYQELVESPLAISGDWEEGNAVIAEQSLLVYRKYWKTVGSISAGLMIYDISTCQNAFMVGRVNSDKDKFIIVARLDLSDVAEKFGYIHLKSVDQVVVRENLRGLQIGTRLYRFIVAAGTPLLSDQSQYFGARRLWARLSHQADITVDVVDTLKQQVVANDVQLHQGRVDADFDSEYWSYDINAGKHNIRFVLRTVHPTV